MGGWVGGDFLGWALTAVIGMYDELPVRLDTTAVGNLDKSTYRVALPVDGCFRELLS